MKEIDDIYLSGSSTIRALVGMSEQFDKKLITQNKQCLYLNVYKNSSSTSA